MGHESSDHTNDQKPTIARTFGTSYPLARSRQGRLLIHGTLGRFYAARRT
jgi:hypothetical protein